MLLIDGEEYLTAAEAARALGVKLTTLYAYVSRGLLRSYRQGMKRQRLYRRGEINRMLRLVLAAEDGAVAQPAGARRSRPPIPLAESWIRD
jgi:excisionase family DNA binding protein